MGIYLTSESLPLGPIVQFFGMLMNGLYVLLDKCGIANIGIAIILFTLITRIILYPMTVKQQKSSKLMSIVQPELQAIQKKYEGRKDQQSLMAQQAETREIYEKYGVSMTGSCLQLLIQMPILIALYRVIMNIPAYVTQVRTHFMNIVDAMVLDMGEGGVQAVCEKIKDFATKEEYGNTFKVILSQTKNMGLDNPEKYAPEALKNFVIDFLYKCNPQQLKELLSNFGEDVNTVSIENMEFINRVNSFLGMNLATSPNVYGFAPMVDGHFNGYLLIPILAFLSQFISSWLMQKMQENNKKVKTEQENQMANSMKTMMWTMPLVSAFFTWGFATGLGLYWIASAALMCVQQFIVNIQLKNVDLDELLRKNIEKANKKRAAKNQPLLNANVSVESIKKQAERQEEASKKREEKIEKAVSNAKEKQKFYFGDEENPSSIFAHANMVQKYNEKNNK